MNLLDVTRFERHESKSVMERSNSIESNKSSRLIPSNIPILSNTKDFVAQTQTIEEIIQEENDKNKVEVLSKEIQVGEEKKVSDMMTQTISKLRAKKSTQTGAELIVPMLDTMNTSAKYDSSNYLKLLYMFRFT